MVELTLYHGDCLQVMKELPAQSVDLIICDLPYGCLATRFRGKEPIPRFVDGQQQSSNITTQGCQWDVKIDLEEFWKQVKRIRKNDNTPCIHFCTTKFGADLIVSNPKEFRYDLVWNKEHGVSFLSANKMPMRSHEMIYVFSKAGAFYNRIDEDAPGKKMWNDAKRQKKTYSTNCYGSGERVASIGGDGVRCSLSIINISKNNSSGSHPTQKPNDLYKWLIERYCPAGGMVLDPTFGSGNSVFTAYSIGRNAIGIEKDDTFFQKAEERLNAL